MDALLEHVTLMEALLVSGLARGRVDVEAMAQVFSAFHRPRSPLEPVPLHLPALLWAFDELPEDIGAQDTLWVVGEGVLDGGRDRFTRIGPTEWAVSGGFQQLRQKALALATLSASSRHAREAAVGEETLGELITELAYAKTGEEIDRRGMATRLALALGVDAPALMAAVERRPAVLDRLVRLVQQPHLPQLKTRGINRSRDTQRAKALWREVLSGLAALDADNRPIVVWVAPLWVGDLVSPYVREVRPLLTRWASENAALESLGALIHSGDADAAYLCANLLASFDRNVRDEKENADASVGIFSINDPEGVAVAKVIDTGRLEANALDPRVGDVAGLVGPAPIVLVLNDSDPDVGHTFARLLAEVRAQFVGISVCIGAVGAPGLEGFVAGARAALTSSGTFVFAAPAGGGDGVRPLGLPDASYLQLFGVSSSDPERTWFGQDRDAAFEEHRAQQDALAAALYDGDMTGGAMSQRFWIEASDDEQYLACKRAHIQDAIVHWRAFLGVDAPREEAEPMVDEDPSPDPEPPPQKPRRELKPGAPRDMPAGTFRFRV